MKMAAAYIDNRTMKQRSNEHDLLHIIRSLLESCYAAKVMDIAQQLELSEQKARIVLDELVNQGDAERLRPLGCSHYHQDCYRLIRRTDTAFLWQKQIAVVGRLSQSAGW